MSKFNNLMKQLEALQTSIDDKTNKYNKLKEEYERTGEYDKEYMKICPECGNLLVIDAQICPKCNIKL